jgi:hypothetical protein
VKKSGDDWRCMFTSTLTASASHGSRIGDENVRQHGSREHVLVTPSLGYSPDDHRHHTYTLIERVVPTISFRDLQVCTVVRRSPSRYISPVLELSWIRSMDEGFIACCVQAMPKIAAEAFSVHQFGFVVVHNFFQNAPKATVLNIRSISRHAITYYFLNISGTRR